MSDEKAGPEEEREAAALARALRGDGSADDLPDDALETAALLRASGGGDLTPERQEAVLERVLAGLPAPTRARFPWWRVLAPVGGLAAAVLLALIVLPGGAGPRGPTRLPAPPPTLLAHQAQAAASGRADLAPLRADMQAYRRELYAALDARYAERP